MTAIQNPDAGAVLAYCLLAEPSDLFRVESLAGNRMAAVRGWYGWCAVLVDQEEEADELFRLKVHCQPVGPGYRERTTFEFLIDKNGNRRSGRLNGFLAACGIVERVDDSREIEGRYFSTRNRGVGPADFGPLTNALAV